MNGFIDQHSFWNPVTPAVASGVRLLSLRSVLLCEVFNFLHVS